MILVMLSIVIAIPLMMALYLCLIRPNLGRQYDMRPYFDHLIAHRGMHDLEDFPENSLASFYKAIYMGYGIELDVQLTKDDKLVVFHDEDLKRMCGVNKKIKNCTYDELRKYTLRHSHEKIPLFRDVLKYLRGRVPLIVDIKPYNDWRRTSVKVAKALDTYKGTYCIESFNPLVVGWFRKNRPDVIRGQLADNYFRTKNHMGIIRKFILSSLLLNTHAKPDFIAYNYKNEDQWSYNILRKVFPVVNVAWTLDKSNQILDIRHKFDVFIFENFDPKASKAS